MNAHSTLTAVVARQNAGIHAAVSKVLDDEDGWVQAETRAAYGGPTIRDVALHDSRDASPS